MQNRRMMDHITGPGNKSLGRDGCFARGSVISRPPVYGLSFSNRTLFIVIRSPYIYEATECTGQ